ncbi:hypothetical protein C8Q72DRAFT_880835 [Fomitopsis betulina]|nr:hypothetical protein C8Q72DRAFT_880835 [Fomitopsis betulina]
MPALDDDEDTRVKEEDPLAGRVIPMEPTILETWRVYFAEEGEDKPMDMDNADGPEADERMDVDDEDRPPNECDSNAVWRPFSSELDWCMAKWVISEDVGQKSLNRFLSIPGVVEKLGLTFKDVRELFMKVDGIPDWASWNTSSLTFPNRPDEAHLIRYHDILEVIKALLGNPSYVKHIVYHPRQVFADRSRTKWIFMEMWMGLWWNAVEELLPKGAAVVPVIISTDKTQLTQFSGNKSAYPVYLTLGNIPRAIHRKPSQHACILLGYLPVSKIDKEKITKHEQKSRVQRLFHTAMCVILKPLMRAGVDGMEVTGGNGCDISSNVEKLFWADLLYTDIHLSITPDILHQLYQGVFKHVLSWCQDLLRPKELDHCLRCLPLAFGIHHFKHGISLLAQVSGKEWKEMARILLGCLIGKIPKAIMLAFRSLLDFIYLTQYPTHDDTMLWYMEDTLKTFHQHKHVLITLEICNHLNIPKLHSLLHYVSSICQFGTTDNYNTEMFECLHIDFAKKVWCASNHQDEFPQMMRWISWQEKMALYEVFQKEHLAELDGDGSDDPEEGGDGPSTDTITEAGTGQEEVVNVGNTIKIAKYPPAPQRDPGQVQEQHNAPGFTMALAHYLNDLQLPELRLMRHELS